MKLQQLYSYTRKAIDDYSMIEDGDKIAVGISGGKDSLTLLYALHGLMRFYPKKFTIEAITVDLGFQNLDIVKVQELCQRKESNPCSLCAKMRKGALNNKAEELGCNKVAYAHHKDDIIETMMLSLIYEGRFHSFSPYTYLDRMKLTVIRPLMYLYETDIIGFQNKYQLPVVKSPCPMDGNTKREYAKQLIRQLNQENPGVKERFFHAVKDGNIKGWPCAKKEE